MELCSVSCLGLPRRYAPRNDDAIKCHPALVVTLDQVRGEGVVIALLKKLRMVHSQHITLSISPIDARFDPRYEYYVVFVHPEERCVPCEYCRAYC
jgi:hypothetical protein